MTASTFSLCPVVRYTMHNEAASETAMSLNCSYPFIDFIRLRVQENLSNSQQIFLV